MSVTPEQFAEAMTDIYVAQTRAGGFVPEGMIARFMEWDNLGEHDRGERVKIAARVLDRFTVTEKMPDHGEDS